MVENNCSRLLKILEAQAVVYERLLALSKEKRPVLVKGNIAELEKIIKEEELLIVQVGRLEEQRQVLQQELANHFTLSPEQMTMTELAKRVDGECANKLRLLLKELSATLTNLTDLNKGNSELVKSSIDYINFSLNLLTSDQSDPTYSEGDEAKRTAAAKIFDRKI